MKQTLLFIFLLSTIICFSQNRFREKTEFYNDVYLHKGSPHAGKVLTAVDDSGKVAWITPLVQPTITKGTYSPTISHLINISTASTSGLTYQDIDSIVNVFGTISIKPSVKDTISTYLYLTVPTPRRTSSTTAVGYGNVLSANFTPTLGYVVGNVDTTNIIFSITPIDTFLRSWNINFVYRK